MNFLFVVQGTKRNIKERKEMIFPKTHKSHTCRYDNDKNCYYSQQVIITLKKPLRTPRAVIYAFPFFSDTWRLIGKHKKT